MPKPSQSGEIQQLKNIKKIDIMLHNWKNEHRGNTCQLVNKR